MQARLQRLIYNLRYRRDRYRQFLGIMLIIVLAALGLPASLPLLILGGVLIGVGESIRLWASGHIKKDKELATNGPYNYVRHPLYVGNITLLTGFALACGLWWAIPVAIVFLLLFYPPAIRREDGKLRRLFPSQWNPWAERTRALIPSSTPYQRDDWGQWSFTQSLRQNGEPLIAVFLAICLLVLFRRRR